MHDSTSRQAPRSYPVTARRGQSMVEFALAAPLLVALIVGLLEAGILLSVYVGLSNSAREAARAAAIYQYPGPAPLTSDTDAVPTIDDARELAMNEVISATLNPIIQPAQLTTTPAYVPAAASNPYRAGDTISVTLQLRHTLLWGALGEREIELRAQSAARIEPGSVR
ncbi:MAG TPA: TadE/TadG family type IV pilus assembly protein [Chloroflexaceae bacterium]|nr:TadE/TadG family type IV pilus assembly protein [Chloroflexaceae bacterium]